MITRAARNALEHAVMSAEHALKIVRADLDDARQRVKREELREEELEQQISELKEALDD